MVTRSGFFVFGMQREPLYSGSRVNLKLFFKGWGQAYEILRRLLL